MTITYVSAEFRHLGARPIHTSVTPSRTADADTIAHLLVSVARAQVTGRLVLDRLTVERSL